MDFGFELSVVGTVAEDTGLVSAAGVVDLVDIVVNKHFLVYH